MLNIISNYPTIAIIIIFDIGLLIGLVIHEYAHAWMANYLGDSTAKQMGRLTLNPFKHLDLLGTIALLVAHIGWAKPVPYNPSNLKSDADELKVGLAGMVANLVIALLLGIPLRIATLMGIAHDSSLWLIILHLFLEAQLILIAFNIIPIPPLDGSKIIFQFISFDARMKFERIGPMILLSLIVISFLGYPIIQQFMEPVIRFLSFVTWGTYTAIF